MKAARQLLPCLLLVAGVAGCGWDVRTGPSAGKRIRLVEPRTRRPYWLYLPVSFSQDRRYPLVVTLHGMKPYDNADYQINEWQINSVADTYGFIVVAPVLESPHFLGEFPLRNPKSPSLLRDEQAIYNIMREVYRNFPVDQERVLLTSWSSGGFILHYMLNRYPEMFSAVVARQSNFHPDLLDARVARRYSKKPIYIFYGENDFPAVKREAIESAQWYRRQGFRHLKERQLPALGHRRRPGLAAEFFKSTFGPEPQKVEIIASPPLAWGVPVMATFTAKVPPELGAVTSYEWMLGDSTTPVVSPGAMRTTVIKKTGEYRVKLIVTAGGKRYRSETVLTVVPRELRERPNEKPTTLLP